MNYAEAVKMVRGKTNRESRKVGNNTYARILENGDVAIRLHNTDVVTINPDNIVTLKTGGWQTSTTKDRINQYSPVRVYQEKYQWFVTIDGKEYPFVEGMVVQA
jgi:hypothetical protein